MSAGELVTWPEFERWLADHGIDPKDTAQLTWRPPHAGATADGPQAVEVTTYLRDSFGRRYVEGGTPAVTTRVVPMRRLPG